MAWNVMTCIVKKGEEVELFQHVKNYIPPKKKAHQTGHWAFHWKSDGFGNPTIKTISKWNSNDSIAF